MSYIDEPVEIDLHRSEVTEEAWKRLLKKLKLGPEDNIHVYEIHMVVDKSDQTVIDWGTGTSNAKPGE